MDEKKIIEELTEQLLVLKKSEEELKKEIENLKNVITTLNSEMIRSREENQAFADDLFFRNKPKKRTVF